MLTPDEQVKRLLLHTLARPVDYRDGKEFKLMWFTCLVCGEHAGLKSKLKHRTTCPWFGWPDASEWTYEFEAAQAKELGAPEPSVDNIAV